MRLNPKSGFSLIELIIYFAIFSVAASFLIGILVTTTRISLKGDSTDVLDQEISFVSGAIQRTVRNSSLIDNPLGVASTSLILRMAAPNLDPTRIYVGAASSGIYMQEGTSTAVRLTSDKVKVRDFSAVKYQNQDSLALVEVNLTLDASTTKLESQASRTWRSGIARISAASFDSDLLASSSAYTVGQAGTPWSRIFLGDGTAGSPSYTFSGDTSLGILRLGSSILGISAGGSEIARIDGSNAGNVTLKLGSAARAGCIEMSNGATLVYITIGAGNNIATSTVKPATCQ